jgi:hypothetical protein
MMARFLAPIKRECRAQVGAGGAHKKPDSKESPTSSQARSAPEAAPGAAAAEATDRERGDDGGGGAVDDDGVVRPDRAAVIAARKERKELKKSKQEQRNRGQNKHRDHKASLNARVNASLPSLCKKVARGQACPYGDKCKFSHDIEGYLEKAKELPELPIPCPFASGTPPRQCKYGLVCRSNGCRVAFAAQLAAMKTHGGEQEDAEHDDGGGTLTTHADEFNHLSREVQAQLREVRGKGQYKYEKWHLEHAAYKKALAAARDAGKHEAADKQGACDEGGAARSGGTPAAGARVDQDMDAGEEKRTYGKTDEEGDTSSAHERVAAVACARCTPGLVVPPVTPALSTPVRQPSPGPGAHTDGRSAGAAGAHTHVSAHELGARLLAQGRASEGSRGGGGGGAGGSSSSTPIPGAVAVGAGVGTHELPAPPATPAPSSPRGGRGGGGGRGGERQAAGAEVGVSAYELGARLRREEKKALDFEGKTILAPLTTVGTNSKKKKYSLTVALYSTCTRALTVDATLKGICLSKETSYSVKRDLLQCQKRPLTVSKETY